MPGRTVLLQSEMFSGVVRDVDGRRLKMVQRYHKDPDTRFVRLYDLDADPFEQVDVAAHHPDILEGLRAYSSDNSRRAFRDQREEWQRDDKENALLRSLGYLD